jgi:hypothetical protein
MSAHAQGGLSTYQVTLLFTSFQAFRLWCKAVGILCDSEEANTLHHNGSFLGHYYPAPGAFDGVQAEITVPAAS